MGPSYLGRILPLVLQQLLQVQPEGDPALSQTVAQLRDAEQVGLGPCRPLTGQRHEYERAEL